MNAAIASGVKVFWTRTLSFVWMGICTAIGGVILTSRINAAQPNIGVGYETDAIAACVIGGVSMSGGRGTVLGALLGSLILATIAKALPLVGIGALWQNTIKGVLILVVVMVNVILQRIADRNALKGREM